MDGYHTLQILETIADLKSLSMIDYNKVINTIKEFPELISNLAISVKDAGVAATLLKQISNLGTKAKGSVCKILNDMAASAKHASTVVRNGLNNLQDIVNQLADNIKLSNAIERVAFAGDGFGEYAYKGFYFLVDAGDDVDDAADIIIKNQRVADVVDNVPDNTRREIADILIDNPDSERIASELVDKFDESGKIGGDEVVKANDPINKLLDEIRAGIKNHPLRKEYETKVKELSKVADDLLSQGKSQEEVARTLHQMRRDLGIEYKELTPEPLREYIYDTNRLRYDGDPLGPTFEFLVEKKGKSYADIIDSACRPNENVDKLLNSFERWLRSNR